MLLQLDRAGYAGPVSVLFPRSGAARVQRTARQLQIAIDNIPPGPGGRPRWTSARRRVSASPNQL